MHTLTRWISSLATALTLACAGSPALAKDAPEPVALDGSATAAELADKLVAITDAAPLRGVGKVAIPLFSVQFMTADHVSGETSGFAAAGRARSTAHYSLVGVDQPEFQALTDALYQGLVKALQDSGVQVVPAEAVLAAPTWRKLAAGGVASPLKNDHSITLAPPGMAIYGLNKVEAGAGSNAKAGLFGALSGMSGVVSAIGAATETAPLQQELGGATLLEVSLRVHFVKLTNHNKGFWGRMSSTAEVSGKAYPSITSASMSVRSAHTGSTLSLKNPVALNPAAFSEVREEAKSGGEIAGAIVGGLLRMAIGNKDSESSARFQAVADPVRYREVVGDGLQTVGEMFVARLKAGR
jgi:hypothetical protein